MKEWLQITANDCLLPAYITLPDSKSLKNRVLMLNAYAGVLNHSADSADSGDTLLLKRCLRQLAEAHGEETVIDCQNAGTVFRFLLSFVAQHPGRWVLTGDSRMLQRPVSPLVEALRSLGAKIDYFGRVGFPPLRITGNPLHSGEVIADASVSSQFISSLLLLAPSLSHGLTVHCSDTVVSESYIRMSVGLLQEAGIHVTQTRNTLVVAPGHPRCENLTMEADWSSAAFFYVFAACSTNALLHLHGLKPPDQSLQGDSAVASIYRHFGVNTTVYEQGVIISRESERKMAATFQFDMRSTPDLALPLAVTMVSLGLEATLLGIHHLRFKETDRIEALIHEIAALGGYTEYRDGVLSLHPSVLKAFRPVYTYNDHRMAMAFTPLALVTHSIGIVNPSVVEKSFPHFWTEVKKLGFRIQLKKPGCASR
ncbi:MAG: 3-phosphoshikimate 1-carboxyvinyltransferase [Bacteroidales bacterium]|nr:3-phosphoshikimate 1-carboxyvinyltransferase [Bacteroidales bacterium]